MQLLDTEVAGVHVVTNEPAADERGLFARTFSRADFARWGLETDVEECSTSFNERALTLRGMHHQVGDAAEAKLVRCTRGRVFDVAVDLRPDSPTYLKWAGVELSADDRRALYVPKGCAHGFLTLEDASEVYYQISAPYRRDAGAGIRWDDPAIGVHWTHTPRVISARDASYPLVLDSAASDPPG